MALHPCSSTIAIDPPETEETCGKCECFPSEPIDNCDCSCHKNYEPDGIDMAKEIKYGYY